MGFKVIVRLVLTVCSGASMAFGLVLAVGLGRAVGCGLGVGSPAASKLMVGFGLIVGADVWG